MKLRFVLFIGILLMVFSCKHEIESPSWTVDVVAPIAKTELKLTDLLKDSEVDLDTNSNDELLLVYRLNPIDTNLNDLIADGDLGFARIDTISILEFEIPNINIDFEASLGAIIKGTVLENILIQGTTVSIPTYNIPAKDFNMDAIPNFNELEIESGIIEIKLTNNLPTTIDGLSMVIKNQDPNNQLPNDDIISIPNSGSIHLEMGDDTTITEDINNVLFTNLLQLAVGNYSFLPNPVPNTIDTSVGIKFDIFIHDIVVSRIQGVIETPIPLDSTSDETYIDIQGLDVKKVKIDSGSINISFTTPLQMPLQLNFYSPNLVPDDTIIINVNGSATGTKIIDLSGKEITFDGKNNDTINTFYYELFGFIPPTTVDYVASVNHTVTYDISAYIKPKYVIADVDQVIMEIAKDTFEFDFFKDLDVGSNFSIESAKITLGIENSIGVGCSYDLNVSSENSVDGNSVFTGVNGAIGSASFNQTTEIVTPTYTEVEEDLATLINIKPDLITINGEVTLNSGTDNFIVYDKGISIAPNIEVPLSFIASNLVLSDTADIELPTEISNATLTLIIDNGYPINTQVEVIFLDENYIELETKVHSIPSGKVSGDGRIYEPTRSLMTIEIAKENIEDIKYVNYIASFETSSQTEYNKIYSDYTIVVQIIAKYKSTIGE